MSVGTITGKTQVYGIIGHPVTHSFSPLMHNAAFRNLNLDHIYVAFDVLPENIQSAIQGLKSLNIKGINVTVPHKTHVLPYLDEVTTTAQRIGAVNTIKYKDGKWVGTNTDGKGFLRSLESLSFTPEHKKVVLLGAGGAARAILVALCEAKAAHILIVNRTPQKAQSLVEAFSPIFPEVQIDAVTLNDLSSASVDFLINTTTVGMKSDDSPVDLNQFSQVGYVADIIYAPAKTALLKQAETLNIPFINGIGMLLYQGCEAFEFWTGQSAPVAVMQSELLNHLNQC